MEGGEWTKIKYIHRENTLRNPLNINLNINRENQDSKIGTVCVWGGDNSRRGRVKEGD
jgi:hypothetical protein